MDNKTHSFTSTGTKFWKHPDQMKAYREGITGRSIISTHVAPEGSCQLSCDYCSVKKRKKHFRISLDTIKDYVEKLCSRGLKAAILTGGGEPTLYPQFNELVRWLWLDKNLSVALITNGVISQEIHVWHLFSWVRVSINLFSGWQDKIFIPKNRLNESCIFGCSFIYTDQIVADFYAIARHAKKLGAEYVRILPNCLLEQKALLAKHEEIDYILENIGDPIFFHQSKIHDTPKAKICHQAYFRPYLSELDGGTIFPCDSLVLNNNIEYFSKKYAICRADQILDFLDGKIQMKHDVQKDCTGCVFTDNINMLDDWKKKGIISNIYDGELKYVEFI